MNPQIVREQGRACPSSLRHSLTALRITLALMIARLSVPGVPRPTLASPHAGLAGFVQVLASVEMVAALLLLVPALVRLFAWALIAVFLVAMGCCCTASTASARRDLPGSDGGIWPRAGESPAVER